eukprot:TRINITY_DN73011_c0_g1_i1.p1 TRINITY_DN73011_c0_g1~~TRINITY_DN73011_c0_g1_i1.p1  ORF type:complete len:403 (+),score=54.38 TRINITY_DN73011_c0_g1_i1:100-1308(+)
MAAVNQLRYGTTPRSIGFVLSSITVAFALGWWLWGLRTNGFGAMLDTFLTETSKANLSSLGTAGLSLPRAQRTSSVHSQFPSLADVRRSLSKRLENAVAKHSEVADYALLHFDTLAVRQTLQLTHIMKSAGTVFCMCGWDNNCKAPGARNVGSNCHGGNPEYKQLPAMPKPVHLLHPSPTGPSIWRRRVTDDTHTCEGLASWHQRNGWTLGADENFLVDDAPCPQFFNIIILRDPIERLWSYLNMQVSLHFLSDAFKTPDDLFTAVPLHTDNYHIRVLLGESVVGLPSGRITEQHLELAKRKLEQFELILLMEDLTDQLERTLSWSCENAKGRNNKHDWVARLRNRWGQEQFDQVSARNLLDARLYMHGRALHRQDWRVFSHPAFVQKSFCWNDTCIAGCRS